MIKRINVWLPFELGEKSSPGVQVGDVVHIAADFSIAGNPVDVSLFKNGNKWNGTVGETTVDISIVDSKSALDRIETSRAEGRVLLIGVGSGGSQIAKWLVTSGAVKRMDLVDRDCLEVENLSRHLCSAADVGRSKVMAVKDRLCSFLPNTDIHAHHMDVVTDGARFRMLAQQADIVICGTDSDISRRVVSMVCRELGKPVLFPRCNARASAGDVFVQSPDKSMPCLDCWVTKLPQNETRIPEEDLPAYATDNAPALPGLALDIAPIAHWCARLSLNALSANSVESGLWIWSNRPEGGSASWRLADASMNGLTTARWYKVHIQKDLSCPSCAEQSFIQQINSTAGCR
jgi:molybdopterin/thiamine biosynthesis adenylyltransferase